MVAHGSGHDNDKGKMSDQLYDFCGKWGHTVDQCWDKHRKSKWATKGHNSSNIPKIAVIILSSDKPNSETVRLYLKDVIQISKEKYERLLHSQ